jgi:hypothetical protein
MGEAENMRLHGSPGGPLPHHQLDTSYMKTSRLQKRTNRFKAKNAIRNLERTDTSGERAEWNLNELTQPGAKTLWNQYELKENYEMYMLSDNSFLLRQKDVQPWQEDKFFEDLEKYDKHGVEYLTRKLWRTRFLVARYSNTRILNINDTSDGERVEVTCSCFFFERKSMACRHIYAILNRKPVYTDAKVRWWRRYYAASVHEGLQEQRNVFARLRELEWNGKGVIINFSDVTSTLVPGAGTKPLDWFLDAWDNIVLRGPSYWTSVDSGIRTELQVRNTMSGVGNLVVPENQPPIGLSQDIRLSQTRQQEETTLSQLVEKANSPLFDRRRPNREEAIGATISDEKMKEQMGFTTPYRAFHSLFTDICKATKTFDDWKEVRESLQNLHATLLAPKVKANTASVGTVGKESNVLGIPLHNTSQMTYNREHRYTSPKKKKNKRNRTQVESSN